MIEGRRFLIAGRVQGVFFRESTRARAQQLGLNGHALNCADGRVEVLAFGDPARLDELAQWLAQGTPAARVDRVEVEPATGQAPPEGFTTGWR